MPKVQKKHLDKKVLNPNEGLGKINFSTKLESTESQNLKNNKQETEIDHGNGKKSILKRYKTIILREKNKLKNTMIMITICVGGFHFGYYTVIITNILSEPLSKGVFNLNQKETYELMSNIGFFYSIGSLVACIFTGSLTKRIGRVHSLILFDAIAIFVYFLMTVENTFQLQATMFIAGCITGLNYSVIPSVSAEMLPKRLNMMGGVVSYLSLVVSMFVASFFRPVLGGYEGLLKNWKLLVSVGAFFALIRLVCLTCLLHGTDSPSYYLQNIKNDDKRLMKKIYQQLCCFYERKCSKNKAEFLVAHQKELEDVEKGKKGYFYVFNKEIRPRFFLGLLLNLFSQLTGVSLLDFYSYQLFEEINGTGTLMTIILNGGRIIAAGFCLQVAKYPRKSLMHLSYFTTSFFLILILIGLYNNLIWLLGIALFCYVIAVGVAFSVLGVYIAEILDPYPIGLVYCFKFILISGVNLLLPIISEGKGFLYTMWACMISSAVGGVYIYFFCVETKGKTRLEIVKEFLGKK